MGKSTPNWRTFSRFTGILAYKSGWLTRASDGTIPTVSLYEKYGVFGKTPYFSQRDTVGIVQRGKSRFFPRND